MRFAKAVSIKDLKPWGKNPRTHGEDVDALVKSIEHFGWTNPILVQERTNRVIAGHGRLQAAEQARLSHVPVIYLKLNDRDADAYTVADNKLAELSEWDDIALAGLLGELEQQDVEMGLLGFSGDEVNQLLTRVEASLARTDLDEIPAVPKTATTQPGELWALGEHRLLCGDSTNHDDVHRLMGEEIADLVFTDPPYGVDYVGKTKEALTIQNDERNDAGTRAMIAQAIRAWPLKPGGCWYLCGPAGDTETAFRLAIRDAGYELRQCLVWVKQQFVMGRQDYHWRHETLLYGWAAGAGHYFLHDRTQDTVCDEEMPLEAMGKAELIALVKDYRRTERTSVWRESRPTASLLHPTMKPVALVAKALRNSSLRHALVFDGFGGSGTTLIAGHVLERRVAMIEIDPRYCDVIIQRWESMTGGGQAHRISAR